MLYQLARHYGDIACRKHVICNGIVKTVSIFKMRSLHAELGGAAVHFGNERLLAARHRLGKHNGGIVG